MLKGNERDTNGSHKRNRAVPGQPSENIVSLARTVVNLVKTGKGYKGVCPFHKETKPSFHVDEEKQVFYCFGCNVGGGYATLYKLLYGELPTHLVVKKNDTWESCGHSLVSLWGAILNKKKADRMADVTPLLDKLELGLCAVRKGSGFVGKSALGLDIPIDTYVALRATSEFRKILIALL